MLRERVAVVTFAAVLVGQTVAQETVREKRVAGLIELLQDEGRYHSAEAELITIGKPAAEALVKAIREDEPRAAVRLTVLGKLGPVGDELAWFLADYIAEETCGHPLAALHAMGSVVPFCDAATKKLLRNAATRKLPTKIEMRRWHVFLNRFELRYPVDGLGEQTKLVEVMRRDVAHQREAAAEALLHRGAKDAVPALLDALENGARFEEPRPAPVEKLLELRAEINRVHQLVSTYRSGTRLHRGSLNMAKTLEGERDSLLPDTFHHTVAEALIALTPHEARIIPAYAYRLRTHPNPQFRRDAAMELGRHGPHAAVSTLR